MADRTTRTRITFFHPFQLESVVTPFEAGTYNLIVDEDLIDGLAFPAYQRVATHLEIPSQEHTDIGGQYLQVSPAEIRKALAKDGRLPARPLADQ